MTSTRDWWIDSGAKSAATTDLWRCLKLEMVSEDETDVRRPTVAGVFARQPLAATLAAAGVSSRRLPIAAPASARRWMSRTINSMRRIWTAPLDDQIAYACRFVRPQTSRSKRPRRWGRRDWPQYDMAAIFKAVVKRGGASRLLDSRRQDTPAHVLRPHRAVLTRHADETA